GPDYGNAVGAAWSFTKPVTGSWLQDSATLTAGDETGEGFFSGSVALSADAYTALSGGPNDANGVGAAWVFGVHVPAAPTTVAALPANGQVSVSFTAPAGPVESYTVTASPGGASATGTASPIVVGALTNGSSYTFTVHATNASGDGPESAASDAVTPAGPPGAPTAPSAVPGDGQATVSFAAPSSTGGAPVSYYTATASPGGQSASSTGSPITVFGLTNGV